MVKIRSKVDLIKVNLRLNKGEEYYMTKTTFSEKPLYCIWYNKERTRLFFNIQDDKEFNNLFEVVEEC